MNSHLRLLPAAMALALVAGAAGGAAAAASDTGSAAPPNREHCFPTNSWKGWTPINNGDSLLLRIHINDIYRVDLTPGSRVYKSPGYFLVNQVRGSNWICSAIDLDLTLAGDYGFRKPLIATAMRKLTPAEVAAIPKRDLP
jgi:hypothetical protein